MILLYANKAEHAIRLFVTLFFFFIAIGAIAARKRR
jgi:hypothetical protein